MDKSYIAENNAERDRLKKFVEQASDEQLSQPMPAGWTVAGVLAHLAYWDGRALALMNKWSKGSAPSVEDHEPSDVDWVNDAGKPLCLALPPRTAAQLALQLAEEADGRVAALPDEVVEQMIAIGPPFNLSRANHRREHLDEIEAVLR